MQITLVNKKWDVEIQKAAYENGRIALVLIDTSDGSVVAKATVNLPTETIEADEAFIKDYSENKGLYHQLVDNGVISKAVAYAEPGIFLCKVNV